MTEILNLSQILTLCLYESLSFWERVHLKGGDVQI